jgi:hypothetical protein
MSCYENIFVTETFCYGYVFVTVTDMFSYREVLWLRRLATEGHSHGKSLWGFHFKGRVSRDWKDLQMDRFEVLFHVWFSLQYAYSVMWDTNPWTAYSKISKQTTGYRYRYWCFVKIRGNYFIQYSKTLILKNRFSRGDSNSKKIKMF